MLIFFLLLTLVVVGSLSSDRSEKGLRACLRTLLSSLHSLKLLPLAISDTVLGETDGGGWRGGPVGEEEVTATAGRS